jgi:hypothetical protein
MQVLINLIPFDRVSLSNVIRLTEHVAHMGVMRNANKIVARILEGRGDHLEEPGAKWKIILEQILKQQKATNWLRTGPSGGVF